MIFKIAVITCLQPMLITNDATPTLQAQQAIMNHMVFAAQQQQQQQIALDVNNSNNVNGGVIALSNSPASPLASPSSGASAVFNTQQQQEYQQLMEIGSNMESEQQQLQNQAVQELQEALGQAVLDPKLAIATNNSSTTDSLNALSKTNAAAAAAAVAKACGLNPAEQQECLKKLQEGWQIVDLRQRISHKQPKSPVETPPDKQQLLMEAVLNANELLESVDGCEVNSEMKNLATLCTAAAAAAAVSVPSEEFKPDLSQGLDPESIKKDPEGDVEDRVDSHLILGDRETITTEDVVEGSEETAPDEDTNPEADQQFEEVTATTTTTTPNEENTECDLNSPSKNIKLSQRLESLMSTVPLKPDDLSQAFQDLRHEISTDVLTVFPQNVNVKYTGSQALSNALQQHFAQHAIGSNSKEVGSEAANIACSDLIETAEATAASPDPDLIYPASMDTETLKQFANAANAATVSQAGPVAAVATGDNEEAIREEMYDIEVEMDEFFHVIHNVHDPALQVC